MDSSTVFTLWLVQLVARLPEILMNLALCLWVLLLWGRVPASRVWALLGFGLLLVLALLSPGLTVASQYWMIVDHIPARRVGTMTTIYALVQSTLHAFAYGLLAAAVYTGRAVPANPLPPPLPRPSFPPPL